MPIGAEDGGGVHNAPPSCAWKRAQRSMSGSLFSLQVSFTTIQCRATGCSMSATIELWASIRAKLVGNMYQSCGFGIFTSSRSEAVLVKDIQSQSIRKRDC
jgi:hypothetical protein